MRDTFVLPRFVEQLRQQKPDCTVPDFDPNGPLETTDILFLLMKPGTRGAGENNIVSLTANDDQTARNMRELFLEVGLGFNEVLLWNVCPWYDGKRGATREELSDGLVALETLISLLPNLRTVVLVGNHAHKAEKLVSDCGLRVVKTAHPSPLVRNINPELYAQIAPAWKTIR